MAERVVHVLEVVDVEIEHGERRGAAQARIERHGQPPDESAAIGEIGEKVGLRELEDLAVGRFEPESVAERSPHIGNDRAEHQDNRGKDEPRAIIAYQSSAHWNRDEVPVSIAQKTGPDQEGSSTRSARDLGSAGSPRTPRE